MYVRAYLRASTKEQDALRAKDELVQLAKQYGQKIATFYVENESGATLVRPELMRLLEEAHEGDVILVEQVDRLARLNHDDWETLKQLLAKKKLAVVSRELPTSALAFSKMDNDSFTDAMLRAVNGMMLDMLAAIARKDYDDRRRRQAQGIKRARELGKFRGRQPDTKKRELVKLLLKDGKTYTEVQQTVGCSRALVASVSKELKTSKI